MARYEFTPQQHQAVAEIVIDHWNKGQIQTGFGMHGVPFIYFKESPTAGVIGYEVWEDGTLASIPVRPEF